MKKADKINEDIRIKVKVNR